MLTLTPEQIAALDACPPAQRRSVYFRDPAGNSIELADPAIWD